MIIMTERYGQLQVQMSTPIRLACQISRRIRMEPGTESHANHRVSIRGRLLVFNWVLSSIHLEWTVPSERGLQSETGTLDGGGA